MFGRPTLLDVAAAAALCVALAPSATMAFVMPHSPSMWPQPAAPHAHTADGAPIFYLEELCAPAAASSDADVRAQAPDDPTLRTLADLPIQVVRVLRGARGEVRKRDPSLAYPANLNCFVVLDSATRASGLSVTSSIRREPVYDQVLLTADVALSPIVAGVALPHSSGSRAYQRVDNVNSTLGAVMRSSLWISSDSGVQRTGVWSLAFEFEACDAADVHCGVVVGELGTPGGHCRNNEHTHAPGECQCSIGFAGTACNQTARCAAGGGNACHRDTGTCHDGWCPLSLAHGDPLGTCPTVCLCTDATYGPACSSSEHANAVYGGQCSGTQHRQPRVIDDFDVAPFFQLRTNTPTSLYAADSHCAWEVHRGAKSFIANDDSHYVAVINVAGELGPGASLRIEDLESARTVLLAIGSASGAGFTPGTSAFDASYTFIAQQSDGVRVHFDTAADAPGRTGVEVSMYFLPCPCVRGRCECVLATGDAHARDIRMLTSASLNPVCSPGWSGAQCATQHCVTSGDPEDSTASWQPCGGPAHGTCVDNAVGPGGALGKHCQCRLGWKGAGCEVCSDVPTCTLMPSEQGNHLVDAASIYRCPVAASDHFINFTEPDHWTRVHLGHSIKNWAMIVQQPGQPPCTVVVAATPSHVRVIELLFFWQPNDLDLATAGNGDDVLPVRVRETRAGGQYAPPMRVWNADDPALPVWRAIIETEHDVSIESAHRFASPVNEQPPYVILFRYQQRVCASQCNAHAELLFPNGQTQQQQQSHAVVPAAVVSAPGAACVYSHSPDLDPADDSTTPSASVVDACVCAPGWRGTECHDGRYRCFDVYTTLNTATATPNAVAWLLDANTSASVHTEARSMSASCSCEPGRWGDRCSTAQLLSHTNDLPHVPATLAKRSVLGDTVMGAMPTAAALAASGEPKQRVWHVHSALDGVLGSNDRYVSYAPNVDVALLIAPYVDIDAPTPATAVAGGQQLATLAPFSSTVPYLLTLFVVDLATERTVDVLEIDHVYYPSSTNADDLDPIAAPRQALATWRIGPQNVSGFGAPPPLSFRGPFFPSTAHDVSPSAYMLPSAAARARLRTAESGFAALLPASTTTSANEAARAYDRSAVRVRWRTNNALQADGWRLHWSTSSQCPDHCSRAGMCLAQSNGAFRTTGGNEVSVVAARYRTAAELAAHGYAWQCVCEPGFDGRTCAERQHYDEMPPYARPYDKLAIDVATAGGYVEATLEPWTTRVYRLTQINEPVRLSMRDDSDGNSLWLGVSRGDPRNTGFGHRFDAELVGAEHRDLQRPCDNGDDQTIAHAVHGHHAKYLEFDPATCVSATNNGVFYLVVGARANGGRFGVAIGPQKLAWPRGVAPPSLETRDALLHNNSTGSSSTPSPPTPHESHTGTVVLLLLLIALVLGAIAFYIFYRRRKARENAPPPVGSSSSSSSSSSSFAAIGASGDAVPSAVDDAAMPPMFDSRTRLAGGYADYDG